MGNQGLWPCWTHGYMVKLCGTASRNRVTTPAPVDLSLELGLVMDKFGLSVHPLAHALHTVPLGTYVVYLAGIEFLTAVTFRSISVIMEGGT